MLLWTAGPILSLGADQAQWGQAWSRNMVSSETGLVTAFDPRAGRNVKWSVPLGTSTYSTPVVARGRVLIGTNNGNPRDPRHRGDRGVLLCLDEGDGRLHWQLVVPKLPHDPYLDCPGVGITSTATVEDDRVYIVSNRGEVVCLDLHGLANGNDGPFRDEARHAAREGEPPIAPGKADADILWVFDVPRELGTHPHDSSPMSVLLHGPHLYVSTPNGVNHTHRHRPAPEAPGLIVLDKLTGRLLACDTTGVGARIFHSTFSSPALGMVEGRPLVFSGGADGVVYAFEALGNPGVREADFTVRAGTLRGTTVRALTTVWSFDCDPAAPKTNISQYQGNRDESPSSIVGMPVFAASSVFVAVGGDPWHGKREAWLKRIDAGGRGDVTARVEVWSHALERHSITTPSVRDGLVFIADFGRHVRCVDARSGRLLWTHDTGNEVWASTLVADGKVYVGARNGNFWVLAANREKQVLHSAKFNEPIHASPVAANGVLYLATMSRLYALAPAQR